MEVGGGSERRWSVAFYETSRGEAVVRTWVDHLGRKPRAKVDMVLGLLAEEGPNLQRPYSAPVDAPIRELRIGFSGIEYRLLYYFRPAGTAVVLHGFVKKTQAIPPREIRTAMDRMSDLERRIQNGEVEDL